MVVEGYNEQLQIVMTSGVTLQEYREIKALLKRLFNAKSIVEFLEVQRELKSYV